MNVPPDPGISLASIRTRAHMRRGGRHDCPTCGARESIRRGRCMTCGVSITSQPGLVRRAVRWLLRRSG